MALVLGTEMPASLPALAQTLDAPASATATIKQAEAVRALALLNAPCPATTLAQAAQGEVAVTSAADPNDASAQASPSASPSPAPTAPGPIMPAGPGILVPPALGGASPTITAPPPPTPSPTPLTSLPPVIVAPVSPLPLPTVPPQPTLTSGPIGRNAATATPSPNVGPSAPAPVETLGPNDYAILGDSLSGNREAGPWDLVGNVNLIYQDGVLVGDRAHYDGVRYIDVTGNTYLRNRAGNSTFTADGIRFDVKSQQATLINGRGVSSQGVERGLLHYSAKQLITDRNGHTHGIHASLTTCENPHSGYHLEAKTLDILPNQRAVAHAAVLYLGPLAVFFLPVVVIPLVHDPNALRQYQGFIPLIGYSAAEGYYVKARIGFAPSPTYYGYYRIEGYTKIGFGLGYVATISRKDGKRVTHVDVFTQRNTFQQTDTTNASLTDQENFSKYLRGTANFQYQGNYGPLLSLPPTTSTQLGLSDTTAKNTENISYNGQASGSSYSSENFGLSQTHQFSPTLNNAINISYTTSRTDSSYASTNNSLHVNTDTHLSTKGADYDLTIDRTDATVASAVDKLPELMVRPHGLLFPNLKWLPSSATFTVGEYSDPNAGLATQRAEGQFMFGPALAHTPVGDFNATVQVRQDLYGTGDEKALIQQQLNLTTPLGSNVYNTLSYNDQHVNGLPNEPFTFDTVGGPSKSLQEVLRLFNADAYTLTLQTGTLFNGQAEPISYQLLTRPAQGVALALGGNWIPGPGNGFQRENTQLSFPLSRYGDVQFQTFVDWKAGGRLESKQVYWRQIIGNCYEVHVAYNQDLKTVNVAVDILAFPSQSVNFGLGQQTSIIPQSFASDAFYGR
jgi:hypothetical protein